MTGRCACLAFTAEVPPRRVAAEPPGWEGTRAVHDRLYGSPVAPVERRSSAARPRLTPHQREVFGRLRRWSDRVGGGWVALDVIGSRAALDHLVDKGHAERTVIYGPRGGRRPLYRPLPAPPVRPPAGGAR
jgi:hypothetical protein